MATQTAAEHEASVKKLAVTVHRALKNALSVRSDGRALPHEWQPSVLSWYPAALREASWYRM